MNLTAIEYKFKDFIAKTKNPKVYGNKIGNMFI